MRNIKRQKEIKAFLIETFGETKGTALSIRHGGALDALIESEKDKSKGQRKALTRTILPCIALYQVLAVSEGSKEAAYTYVQKYMRRTAEAQHASTARMEAVPGFYALYSRIFLAVMRVSDLWESTQTRGRDSFDVAIRKCLWHSACTENGCAELCRLFCEADNVTYGGLKKIGFTHTKTLGCGGDCCDFHFYRKSEGKR